MTPSAYNHIPIPATILLRCHDYASVSIALGVLGEVAQPGLARQNFLHCHYTTLSSPWSILTSLQIGPYIILTMKAVTEEDCIWIGAEDRGNVYGGRYAWSGAIFCLTSVSSRIGDSRFQL